MTLAIPCRCDEPALGRTLADAWTSWCAGAGEGCALEVLVCLNGGASIEAAAANDLRRFGHERGVAVRHVDLDGGAAPQPEPGAPLAVTALAMRRAGKALAWNALRRYARGARTVFLDADVSVPRPTFDLLLATLAQHPEVTLASARTACDARPTWFERVMAVPYHVTFRNLSPQLYAARTARLPDSMPETLLEPERWLELTVGADAIAHAAGARVVVRLPATLRDFFRQRVRIEMAKVQIAAEYPHLLGRGSAQPGWRDVLRQLRPPDLLRLGVYLALRESAHLVARRGYARGRAADVWRPVASTKDWDAA